MRVLPWLLVPAIAGCPTPDDAEPDEVVDTSPAVAGSCAYVNTFSQGPECKAYTGDAWTAEAASEDCATPFPGAAPGTFTPDEDCAYDAILGTCTLDAGTPDEVVLHFPGDDPADCGGAQIGCGFGGGTFTPSDVCSGDTPIEPPAFGVFQPFEEVCVEPVDGEPAGASDGDVCTWNAISACTEPGRKFVDYGSCEVVLTQRPYAPRPREADTAPGDPRLSDASYLAELDWVTEQVEACACICCHSEEAAPRNVPSNWYLEAGPLWVDSLGDEGLAMLAGWVDSTAFGAFPPEDNNGFDRETTGLPTTDIPRMVAFLEGELARRGLTPEDFTDTPAFGGPLADQLVFTPTRCTNGEGVDAEGRVIWPGLSARYVYILEAGSANPGVPPNLDLPDGTIWRLDVPPSGTPVASGVGYGVVPTGAVQKFPTSGAPAALVSGRDYLVYVLLDVAVPLARCVFTAP